MEIRYAIATPELKERFRGLSSTNASDFIRFDDDHCSILALVGQQPVGLIVAKRRPLPAPLDHTIEVFIDIIEVLPEHRRQGIGTALLERIVQWALDCRAIQVRAWSEEIRHEALMLWLSSGFTFSRVDFQRGDESRYGFYVARRL